MLQRRLREGAVPEHRGRSKTTVIFSRQDLQVEEWSELLAFLPILVFVALVTPFLLAGYTLGFCLSRLGLLED